LKNSEFPEQQIGCSSPAASIILTSSCVDSYDTWRPTERLRDRGLLPWFFQEPAMPKARAETTCEQRKATGLLIRSPTGIEWVRH
jgi:hypothetical protein